MESSIHTGDVAPSLELSAGDCLERPLHMLFAQHLAALSNHTTSYCG